MKNQWIRWADRNDLECAYLVVTSERIDYRVINDEGDIESYDVSVDFIYILGKVPNEYFDKIIDRAWEKLASSFISDVEIKTESQICHDDKMKAMRDYEQRNAENHYLTVLETVQYYQNKDYQIFTYHNKFLGEIAARTSTASQPNQEQTDAAEQTDTPNQTRAASSSNDGERMEKELSNIHGMGAIGRRRMIMKDKYHLTISQIWEYENPDGKRWLVLDADLRHAITNKIDQSIKRARQNSQSEK